MKKGDIFYLRAAWGEVGLIKHRVCKVVETFMGNEIHHQAIARFAPMESKDWIEFTDDKIMLTNEMFLRSIHEDKIIEALTAMISKIESDINSCKAKIKGQTDLLSRSRLALEIVQKVTEDEIDKTKTP